MIANLVVQIVRCFDDPFPGFVECILIDADGRRHAFIDKGPVVSTAHLRADSIYPQPGYLGCTVDREWVDGLGRRLVQVTTESPWSIASTTGEVTFTVLKQQIGQAAPVQAGLQGERVGQGSTPPSSRRVLTSLAVLAGCVCGGAVSASIVLVLGAHLYFGTQSERLITFLETMNPWAGACGAVTGMIVFVFTPGRGHILGLAGRSGQCCQTRAPRKAP